MREASHLAVEKTLAKKSQQGRITGLKMPGASDFGV